MTDTVRVFVNGDGLRRGRGRHRARRRRAAMPPTMPSAVRAGALLVTDSRGLPVPADTPLFNGAMLRLVPNRERDTVGSRGPLRRMTPTIDRELLRLLPKAELHCHLDGSVRPATLLELGASSASRCPRPTRTSLREFMRVDDARNLEDYLERFDVTLSVMQTEPALERIAYELAEDAAADGVRYIEVRYAPVLNTREGLTLEQAVEAPLRGLARAERDHGIVGRVIVCALRHMPPSVSLELARARGRVQGIAASSGSTSPAARSATRRGCHAAAFEYARSHDLACTCHAGEGDGADVGARGGARVRRAPHRPRDAPHRGPVAHRLRATTAASRSRSASRATCRRAPSGRTRRTRSASTSSAGSTSCSTPTTGS